MLFDACGRAQNSISPFICYGLTLAFIDALSDLSGHASVRDNPQHRALSSLGMRNCPGPITHRRNYFLNEAGPRKMGALSSNELWKLWYSPACVEFSFETPDFA